MRTALPRATPVAVVRFELSQRLSLARLAGSAKKQIDASPSLAVVVRAAFVLAAVLLRNNFLSLSNGMTEARSQPNGDVIPIAVGAGVDVFQGGTGHSLKHVWTPAAPLTFKLMDCTTLKPETNHTRQTDDASFPYWRCDILTALAAGFVGR